MKVIICHLFYFLLVSLPIEANSERTSKVAGRLADVLVSDDEIRRQSSKLSTQLKEQTRQNNQILLERLSLFIDDEEDKSRFTQDFLQLSLQMEEELVKRLESELGLSAFMKETTVEIYSREFTDEEIAQLGRFFTSPVGKKYLRVSPLVLEEIVEATQKEIVPKILQVQNTLQDDYQIKFRELHSQFVEQ